MIIFCNITDPAQTQNKSAHSFLRAESTLLGSNFLLHQTLVLCYPLRKLLLSKHIEVFEIPPRITIENSEPRKFELSPDVIEHQTGGETVMLLKGSYAEERIVRLPCKTVSNLHLRACNPTHFDLYPALPRSEKRYNFFGRRH